MKSKMLSVVIFAIMVTSIFGVISQNVGEQRSSIIGRDHLENSSPRQMEIPSLSSNEIEDFVDTPLQNTGEVGLSSSGIGRLADSPWPMFGQNPRHTGLSPYDTSTNPGREKWNFTTGYWIGSSPAIGTDGTIYIGSYDHNLYAIDLEGTEKWNFTTGNQIRSSPAIGSDGTIYFGSDDNNLYALNPDGSKKWNFTTSSKVNSSPTIDSNGTIYVGSYDKNLYAIYPNGTKKWSFTTGDWIGANSAAIGFDNIIYIGSEDQKLYAIYPNGTQNWNFVTGGSVRSTAIGFDGTIYVGSSDKKLYAINPDGTEKWNFITGGGILLSPAIGSDGIIYIGSEDYNLYAIYPNGTKKWNFTTGGLLGSTQAIGSDGTIFVGSHDGILYAINPDGSERWIFDINSRIWFSPAISSDGTIYVGCQGKRSLYAIGSLNIPPIADAGLDQIINEGSPIQLDASSSYDPGGVIESYEWDFDQSDGLWWETEEVPDATGPTPTHIYGDDGLFIATLRVTDNDNLSATDTCNITVQNVDPIVSIESVSMEVEIGLRVAGRKYNNVSMTLYEDEDSLGSVSIERLPGSPNEQMAWIPIILDMTKTYSANITYTPEDPPNVGGNPVWIYIKSKNGNINKIHHNFNVQQSKKRVSNHWNHIDPWEVELNPHLIGLGFEITSHVTDPGSDDETLTYTYGSQTVTVTYQNNPPNPDPYPSPEVNPVDMTDTTTLIYKESGTLTLMAKDDDNIRLGMGHYSDSIDIT